MTPKSITEVIFAELNGSDINSWHGITKESLKKLLVNPSIIELTIWDRQSQKYWLVMDENPEDLKEGYLVVYDERENMFGLATKPSVENDNSGVLVGLYGSFVDTLSNM